MLDAKQIEDMSDAEKLRALEQLSAGALPGATNTAIAEALGVQRRTFQGWRQYPGKIPAMALMLLQEWAAAAKDDRASLALGEIAEDFARIAGRMEHLAKDLAPKS